MPTPDHRLDGAATAVQRVMKPGPGFLSRPTRSVSVDPG